MYCTLDDILSRLSEAALIDLASETDSIDDDAEDVVALAITDACATIDVYLAGRYTVPLSTTPEAIVPIAVDLAISVLEKKRGHFGDDATARYNRAVDFLKLLANGKVSLGITETSDTPRRTIATSKPRMFERGDESSEDYYGDV